MNDTLNKDEIRELLRDDGNSSGDSKGDYHGYDLTKNDSTAFNKLSSLDLINDIPITLSLEVGRTTIRIRNLLQLNQGSVVELETLAGEPLDVLVNGTLVAHGEVVVLNDKFGVRLTDVINTAERINSIK